MTAGPRFRAVFVASRRSRHALRLATGCASLALLSACAAPPGRVAQGPTTGYYVSHAAHDYTPPGPPGDPWGPYITEAASRFDVPSTWIRQVMRVESGGHEYIDGQLTVSGAGAMGLMQLEPETYQEMASRYGLGNDPFNPYDNIMAGTAYIHEMYRVYGSPGFLAAYNAGPGRLDSYMNYHEPLPDETENYVAMIAPNIEGAYPAHRSEADQLALNTEPANEMGGILPAGFVPVPPGPESPEPEAPSAPVQVAAIVPSASPDSSIFAPQPVAQSNPLPPPTPQPSAAPVQAIREASYSVSASSLAAPSPELPPPPPVVHHSFSIIPVAMADTPPPAAEPRYTAYPEPRYTPYPAPRYTQLAPAHSGWAIQVGAYDTSSNARAALGIAELSAVQMLMNGRAMVVSVNYEGRTKYRARVVGLPHEVAVDACGRLSGGPTGCEVLSPEAQS